MRGVGTPGRMIDLGILATAMLVVGLAAMAPRDERDGAATRAVALRR